MKLQRRSALNGTKLAVASYPKLDDRYSDHAISISFGHIVQTHSNLGYHLAAGDYACARGSSGGGVLNKEGYLLGMHLGMEFYEDHTYFESESSEIVFSEPYYLFGEETVLSEGEDLLSGQSISDGSPEVLSKHAALHIPEKCAFGFFLPANIIQSKFDFISGSSRKAIGETHSSSLTLKQRIAGRLH